MRWFGRAAPRVPSDPLPASVEGRNHLITARHEFANAFGDLARGKRNWQVMAFSLAGLLGVSERSLWYRVKKLGIQVRTEMA